MEAVSRGLRAGVAEHPGTEIAQILCFIDNKPEWAKGVVGKRRFSPAARARAGFTHTQTARIRAHTHAHAA